MCRQMRRGVVLFLPKSYSASEINSRTCAWHDPGAGRQVAVRRAAEYAGKCNAPGCTKVTKCHLPKATRCAPLQVSSRRPVCNYMFLFSFLLSCLFFFLSSFIIPRPPARVRTYGSKRAYGSRNSHETDTYSRLSGRRSWYCAAKQHHCGSDKESAHGESVRAPKVIISNRKSARVKVNEPSR